MKGRKVHKCDECVQSFDEILDHEVSTKQRNEFLQSLQSCPRCMERFEREKSFREFIQAKFPKKPLSANFMQSLRSCLLKASHE
ncbi:MAG: hypothetical protein R2798_08675 [Chitinophagales bacterium]|nr:hypothetical protein [Bacteroidota bacterium]MCB9043973.1 hypothetical protein [Chitinophagales bacterium]